MSFQERRSISIGQRRDRETKDSSAVCPGKKRMRSRPRLPIAALSQWSQVMKPMMARLNLPAMRAVLNERAA